MVPLRPVKNCSARGHVDAVLTESTFLSHRLVHHRHSQQTVEPLLESLNAQSLQPPHRQPQTCSARIQHRSSSIRSRPQAYHSEFAQRTYYDNLIRLVAKGVNWADKAPRLVPVVPTVLTFEAFQYGCEQHTNIFSWTRSLNHLIGLIQQPLLILSQPVFPGFFAYFIALFPSPDRLGVFLSVVVVWAPVIAGAPLGALRVKCSGDGFRGTLAYHHTPPSFHPGVARF
ncbi:hypothetical protein FSHL1_003297 [Fusarium sambucinum]